MIQSRLLAELGGRGSIHTRSVADLVLGRLFLFSSPLFFASAAAFFSAAARFSLSSISFWTIGSIDGSDGA